MLKKAFASVLRFMRRQGSVTQTDLEGGISQSHISRLERAESSITLDKLEEISDRLNVHPLTIVTLTWGANEQTSPARLLERVREELERLDGLLHPIQIDDQPAEHPRITKAGKVREEVQRLKSLGHSKAEVSRMMGIARSTAARHW